MNLSNVDYSKYLDNSAYGEFVRLTEELMPKQVPIYNEKLQVIGYREKLGFDWKSAPYSSFTNWLNNTSIKKSRSLFWTVIDIMIWRFPEKHNEIRNNIADNRKLEFDLHVSEFKKEYEWIGCRGYQNMVELNPDSIINRKDVRIIKKSNDRFKFVRK